MSTESKSQRLRQQAFVTQLLERGLLAAGTPVLASRRLRKMLVFWCGHDYRAALTAGLVAGKGGARPIMGRCERLAMFRQGDRRIAAAAAIVHRVVARAAGTVDATTLLDPGGDAGAIAWAVAAACGDDPPDPGEGLDGETMASIIEHTVRLLSLLGYGDPALELGRAWAEIERRWRDRSDTLVLAPLYSANIGHQAIVAALVQACGDGVFAQRAVHALPGRPHNPYLVSRLAPTLAPAPAETSSVEPISGGRIFMTAAGELLSMTELMSRAADRWRETGPPLALDPETRQRGDAALAAIGIPVDVPLVSLHVREPGWHVAHGEALNIRDADIADYGAAIGYLQGRGIRVIRLGDPTMTPLPAAMTAFDYAHSTLKADWMDVYLAARCRFHIGTASGMSFIPTLFGRPVLFTNYAPVDHLLDPRSTVTIFKVPRDLQGRAVPPSELAGRARHAVSATDLELLGLWLQDNDADDILDAVRFVEEHVDAGSGDLRFSEGTFAASDAALAGAGFPKRPQIPPRFWNRHYGAGPV
jgi:putative glycosyltransferase (TIGR04372 family)